MDPFNLIKIITTLITSIISLIIGIRVLILNKTDWLNRWFFLFFISSSIGFLVYSSYHLILNNPEIIIPLMITAQIFYNFPIISLTMTIFVLEKYTKIAMSMKYLGTMLIIFFVMSIGYFIFIPTLDMDSYNRSIVNTTTPLVWLISVNTIRIILAGFVVYKYTTMVKKIESEAKSRLEWFTIGIIFIIIGLFSNLIGGAIHSIIMEILALIIIDIGAFLIFKGFLI